MSESLALFIQDLEILKEDIITIPLSLGGERKSVPSRRKTPLESECSFLVDDKRTVSLDTDRDPDLGKIIILWGGLRTAAGSPEKNRYEEDCEAQAPQSSPHGGLELTSQRRAVSSTSGCAWPYMSRGYFGRPAF